jgi:DNA helicase-2/ATP-dependent DNA helicase PcrA
VVLLDTLGRCHDWPAELDQVNRWYAPHLQRLHDDAAVRGADLAQLARIAHGYASRERFLTELTLDPPDATSNESGAPHRDEDYLILSTIHSAKGQEWQAVTLLNAVDGCMPSDMATGSAAEIEEERRLLYVAMTRAKQVLQLMVPLRFHVHQQAGLGDRHVYASLTRFITPASTALFQQVAAVADRAGGSAAMELTLDVGSRLRARWA